MIPQVQRINEIRAKVDSGLVAASDVEALIAELLALKGELESMKVSDIDAIIAQIDILLLELEKMK